MHLGVGEGQGHPKGSLAASQGTGESHLGRGQGLDWMVDSRPSRGEWEESMFGGGG